MKNSGLNTFYLTRIIFKIHFLSSKSTLQANKCEEHAVADRFMEMAAITCYLSTWSHLVDQKALETSLACFRIGL